jgi:putative transposase
LGKRFKGAYALHSQSIQTLVQKLDANVNAARQLKKENPDLRYLYRAKKYQTVVWKASAIHWGEYGRLLLSNGKRTPGLGLPIPEEYWGMDLCQAELTWRGDHSELCLTLDTGQVNIAAAAEDTLVASGQTLRSVKQLRNKRHAALTSRFARCKPGSKRQRKLMKGKPRISAKLRRQQRDILHKASRRVVAFYQARTCVPSQWGMCAMYNTTLPWASKPTRRSTSGRMVSSSSISATKPSGKAFGWSRSPKTTPSIPAFAVAQ